MDSQVAEAEVHASVSPDAVSIVGDLPVSVNLICERLYLGNLTTACDQSALRSLGVTHVLSVDAVPLPRAVLDARTDINFKYVHMADVDKEDLISHLPDTNKFIQQALDNGGTVLVHCYFGVSRSASIVIAYMMTKHGLCYRDAYELVRAKRRFVKPNNGFEAQLRLFGHMGCRIDKDDPRYKQFRLRLAGQKLKEVKILPQLFAEVVRPDPGVPCERPDPLVYRCRKCRRIVASQRNLIPHLPKQVKIELAKKASYPKPSAKETACVEAGEEILVEKLRSLSTADVSSSHENEYDECLVDGGVRRDADSASCRLVYFVEPMEWMEGVRHTAQGKLHCPKCRNKIGSYSWLMGCRCPCGKKVAPAFYLVPSKVEWSNIVQNVQLTV